METTRTINFTNPKGIEVKDKATALQYALEISTYWNDGKYDVDFEKAKKIFTFFCENVNLPDVIHNTYIPCPKDMI